MKKRYFILIMIGVIITLGVVFSETIVLRLVGVQELEVFSQKDYEESLVKLKEKYPERAQFLISTQEQFISYSSLVEKDKQYILTKPIQLLYFKEDSLVSIHSSCNVPINYWTWKLDWNIDNRFEQFPPLSSTSTLDIKLKQIQDVYGFRRENTSENTLTVFWSRMMEKQVYGALETVIYNKRLSNKKEKLNTIFINVDHAFLGKIVLDE
ncbi:MULTISPECIES: hypothetical protein [Myroides]|uniref:POTRA domain-containing protein n=1 Tax=Myroides odoratimimus CIP 101113 TaxID=883154 RepID=A0AAV3F0T5_9FLAO|nr:MULTISPECIES: hypothetical protein [Myroides]APA93888.1 hypothetical protein BK054_17000 [Myroides sp. ZB35]EHO08975.1 hypothetical protein HMPREF9715_02530 [Myroides odoratimimus CIP 101113]EKB05595.1 hypothetical protein HMPREF9711_01161 [Myroides odoratimimus CCUG 3837]MCA4793773.1 hypothetical protein [Myroides odoratimimus]MCA4821021.1 hypothetical protein [Myroides odoratimimus]